MQQIRNFSIIAHIDHGKSTLADRFLEVTGTIEARQMRDQVLDSMDLERERGITIKMQPVRMRYTKGGTDYLLHLIDTPGHIDFSYEVSRALTAVEGAILLVDATQGVQAQTLTTLRTAQELGLVIIPAISKIDSPLANVEDVREQVAALLEICRKNAARACVRFSVFRPPRRHRLFAHVRWPNCERRHLGIFCNGPEIYSTRCW